MSNHFKQIYATQAAKYDAMVSCEDYQGNLLQALLGIHNFNGSKVVDVGAGTGRVTRLLEPYTKWITAVDISHHMLQQADTPLSAVADACHLPIKSKTADVAIAGWALGHSIGWYPETWQTVIWQAIESMQRVLQPNGTLILLETMGTGTEIPTPPHEGLAAYYRWLENDLGFAHTTIPTDYKFTSVTQAIDLTQYFFGDALAEKILQQQLTILPEFTGIWWRTKSVVH